MDEELSPEIRAALRSIYEEVMWLAQRPNVTPGRARSWYTHVMAESLKRSIRRFTGMVSRQAVENTHADLRLEHFMRIQTTLTQMVGRHRALNADGADEFIRTLVECEAVHIVTRDENYAAMRAKGCYLTAGIDLIPWDDIPQARQAELWRSMLRSKVSNAQSFRGWEQ